MLKLKVLVICSDDTPGWEANGRDFVRIKNQVERDVKKYFSATDVTYDFLDEDARRNTFPIDIKPESRYNVFWFAGCNALYWIFNDAQEFWRAALGGIFLAEFKKHLVNYYEQSPIIFFTEASGIQRTGPRIYLNPPGSVGGWPRGGYIYITLEYMMNHEGFHNFNRSGAGAIYNWLLANFARVPSEDYIYYVRCSAKKQYLISRICEKLPCSSFVRNVLLIQKTEQILQGWVDYLWPRLRGG